MAATIAAEFQKISNDRGVLYLDLENGTTRNRLEQIGLNPELSYCDDKQLCAEDVWDIIRRCVATNKFCAIVIDSSAAMIPRSQIELNELNPSFDEDIGEIMSRGLKVVNPELSKAGTVLIFTHQLRSGLTGVIHTCHPTGGNIIGYYDSLRLGIEPLRGRGNNGGRWLESKVIVMKNKCGIANPGTSVKVKIPF